MIIDAHHSNLQAYSESYATNSFTVVLTPTSTNIKSIPNTVNNTSRSWRLYILVLLTCIIIGGIIGIVLGLRNKSNSTGSEGTTSMTKLNLIFDTTGKVINVSSISLLRCTIQNYTSNTPLSQILLTGWKENNGTVFQVTSSEVVRSIIS